jgi:hypothetical protein
MVLLVWSGFGFSVHYAIPAVGLAGWMRCSLRALAAGVEAGETVRYGVSAAPIGAAAAGVAQW